MILYNVWATAKEFVARKYWLKRYLDIQGEFETADIIYFSRCLLSYLLRNALSVSLRYFGGLETHPSSDSLAESSSSVDM